MPLRHFPNDRITLIKKDGRQLDDLPVSVQSDKILTNDPKIPIEDGDWFERQTPGGVTERCEILEAGCMQAFHHIAAHYTVLTVTGRHVRSTRKAAAVQLTR